MKKTIEFAHKPFPFTKWRKLDFDQVEKLYIGEGNCCRCGCGGEYFEPDTETGRAKIWEAMEEIEKFHKAGKNIHSLDNFIFEIQISNEPDLVFCIYTKQ